PCLVGARTFQPYDTAQFAPSGQLLAPDAQQALNAESNFDVTETPVWFVPELQRARRSLLEERSLPNWNPTARTGTALLPHGHDGILYPPVWPALLSADPSGWLGWLALINLTVAGGLMFGFLRAQGLRPAAAAFGAVACAMSTTLCANAHNYPRLSSLVWLPGMLWALRAAHDRDGAPRLRALAGFAGCFALTWIGGFPPYALPCALIAALYGVRLWLPELRSRPRPVAVRRGVEVGSAALLGVLLCSHYLLPAFAFFGESARTLHPDLDRLSQSAFDWYGFLGWLVPDLFGRPDLTTALLPYDRAPLPLLLGHRTSWNGTPLLPTFNATEYALFAGSLAPWLAALALGSRRAPHRWLPLLLLTFCAAMALFAWPLGHLFALPGIQVVPPMRFLGPCSMLLAWLAAQGLDGALDADVDAAARRRARVAAGVALAAAVVAAMFAWRFADPTVFRSWQLAERLAAHYAPAAPDPAGITPERIEQLFLRAPNGTEYPRVGAELAHGSLTVAAASQVLAALVLFALCWRGRAAARVRAAAAVAAVLLTGGELWRAGRTFARGIDGDTASWTAVHEFLVEQRAAQAATGGFMVARAAPLGADGALPPPQSMAPGTLGPLGVRDLQVYTYFDKRSIAPLQAVLARAVGAPEADRVTGKGYLSACLPDDPRVLQHPLLDLLGVRYVFAPGRPGASPLQHAGPRVGPELRGPGGEFYVFERPTALPRAFVVGRAEACADDDAVVAALADPAFAPAAAVLLLQADLDALGAAAPAPDADAAARAVRFARDHATDVVLEVADGPAGWLVLADTWMPGWTVAIDDAPAPLLRADHALRAVPLPARACTVEFRYTAPRQGPGAALLALGLAALALLLWRTRASSRAR
ncbi:MAG: hypothetical protein AB7O84_23485, partial [Planctomycetota bacterium]